MYKKIYVLVFLIITTIMILASVNLKQYNNDLKSINCPPTVKDISVNSNDETKSDSIELKQSTANNTDTKSAVLYGVWSLDKVVMKSGLVETGLEKYLGLKIMYSPQYINFGLEKYYNPQYKYITELVPEFNGKYDYRAPNFYYFIKEEGIQIDGINNYDEDKFWAGLPIQCFEVESIDHEKSIPVGMNGMILNEDTLLLGIWGEGILAHRVNVN